MIPGQLSFAKTGHTAYCLAIRIDDGKNIVCYSGDGPFDENTEKIYKGMRISKLNQIIGQPEAKKFFKPKNKTSSKTEEKFLFVPDLVEYAGSGDEEEKEDGSSDPDAVDLSEDLF